jgi:hypothetical protein
MMTRVSGRIEARVSSIELPGMMLLVKAASGPSELHNFAIAKSRAFACRLEETSQVTPSSPANAQPTRQGSYFLGF